MTTAAAPRVVFATHAAHPDITSDDRRLADALERRGIRAEGVAWDADVDWAGYDAIVLRSTWDFHHRLPAFTRWLQRTEAAGALLVNSGRLVGWNLTKRYLEELKAQGIAIVPTHWLARSDAGTLSSLVAIAEAHGWHEGIVVKPIVSASAHDTWIARGDDDAGDVARLRRSLARSTHGVMLQPFLSAIESRGEWSLIFITGVFSHAVVKRPANGDFRVQFEHGGTAQAHVAPPGLIRDAERVVRAAALATEHLPTDILYARVDGIEVDGRLVLMEFEAIEPMLFLACSADAAERMADGLQAIIAARCAAVDEPI